MYDDNYELIRGTAVGARSKIEGGMPLFDLAKFERIALLVVSAKGVIDNGGFQYFYEADWPNKPPYNTFIDAFKEIGANEAADCIEKSAALFPFPDPHLDKHARNAFLDSQAEESRFEELAVRVWQSGDEIESKLAAYIRKHQPAG